MSDTQTTIGRSVIQHGPNSRRVYLMKLDPTDLPGLHDELLRLVKDHGYGKVFAKLPATHQASFMERGYREEARIPDYYPETVDAVFLGYYADPARSTDQNAAATQAVLKAALAKPAAPPAPLPPTHSLRRLTPADIPALARLYRATFESYPFPITEEDYLKATMASHVAYFGVFDQDQLVAAASAERDATAAAVEMTDFATTPACRGLGFARNLLAGMGNAMRDDGIRTGYTIARAVSHGMNITFARGGYRFGGTLINNTGISGAIESMNVWHRKLGPGIEALHPTGSRS